MIGGREAAEEEEGIGIEVGCVWDGTSTSSIMKVPPRVENESSCTVQAGREGEKPDHIAGEGTDGAE